MKGPGIMSNQSDKFISVFIPTFNGDDYIGECIDMILLQKLPKNYKLEILVTDSGSTDNTLKILKSYGKKIDLTQIPNSDYGHGKTRQEAAERAKGKFILFLSQDASPAHDRWLINMIEPFYVSDKVSCVFGRQIPRSNAPATIKREVLTVFGGLGAPDSIILHRQKSLVDDFEMNSLNTFFSDVNSAIKKDLVNTIPFRDLKYAEDQALAEDMQNAGYLKAYSVHGSVRHSNEYTVKEFCQRKFDEYIGLQESVNFKLSPSLKSLIFGWIKPCVKDIKFTIHDQEYSKKRKIKNIFLSVGYNFMTELGKYRAAKYVNDPEKRAKMSLESNRKN